MTNKQTVTIIAVIAYFAIASVVYVIISTAAYYRKDDFEEASLAGLMIGISWPIWAVVGPLTLVTLGLTSLLRKMNGEA